MGRRASALARPRGCGVSAERSSLYGGPGGGGGGGVTSSGNVGQNGAAGGANALYTAVVVAPPGRAAAPQVAAVTVDDSVLYCGQGGGGGGGGSAAVAGMNGGAGGIGAGGGGGGTGSNSASSSNAGGSGGAGGDGRVIVITYGGTSDTPNVYLHDATDNFTVFFSLSNPDLTVTLPDYAADDVVVLHCATWDTGTTGFGITTPSGWTLLDTPPISTKRGPWVFYRVMDGTEGTTVTLQGSGYVASTNSQKECRATCWRTDVVGGTISLDGSAVVTSATATGDPATATTGTVTTSDLDETVLACMYGDNNALTEFDMTVTTSNWFRRYEDYGGGSSGLWVGLVTKRQLTAASITLSADLDGGAATSDNWRIVAFALMVSPPAVGSFQAIMI